MFWCCCTPEGCQNFAVTESFDSATFNSPEPWVTGYPSYSKPNNLDDGEWIKVYTATANVTAPDGTARVVSTPITPAGFGTCMNFSGRSSNGYSEEWSFDLVSMSPGITSATSNVVIDLTFRFGNELYYGVFYRYYSFNGLTTCTAALGWLEPSNPIARTLLFANIGSWPGFGTYQIVNTRSGFNVDSVFSVNGTPILSGTFLAGYFNAAPSQFMYLASSVSPSQLLIYDNWFSTTAA